MRARPLSGPPDLDVDATRGRSASRRQFLGSASLGLAAALLPRADLLALASEGEGPRKATLVVLDFTFHSGPVRWGHQELKTGALTDRLVTALAKSRRFRLLERERMDDLMEEMELSKQGFTSRQSAVRAGKLTGADFLLFGAISSLGARTETQAIPRTSEHSYRTVGSMRGDIRVVDARTGEIVSAFETTVDRSAEGLTSEQAYGTAGQSMYTALQQAFVDRLARHVVDTVYPPSLVKVAGDRIWINRGREAGFAVGDRLDIVAKGESIVDPATGDTLGSDDETVGSARVAEVQERMTIATVRSSTRTPEVGMLVRKVGSSRRAAPRAEPSPLAW